MAEETIIALKANIKRGFALADFWEGAYMDTLKLTLASWKMLETAGADMDAVEEMAWAAVQRFSHYSSTTSTTIDHVSVIRDMVIPSTTYTTRKGVEKTKPEERIPSHYTQSGQFLGRVSALGEHPIPYEINLLITPTHFKFVGVATTLEGCFALKEDAAAEDHTGAVHKDISKSTRNAQATAPAADISDEE